MTTRQDKTMANGGGVWPLVCGVCQCVVGVINESALAEMLGACDFYVCQECTEDEDMAQTALADKRGDWYAQLVSQVVVADALVVA